MNVGSATRTTNTKAKVITAVHGFKAIFSKSTLQGIGGVFEEPYDAIKKTVNEAPKLLDEFKNEPFAKDLQMGKKILTSNLDELFNKDQVAKFYEEYGKTNGIKVSETLAFLKDERYMQSIQERIAWANTGVEW